MTPSERRRRGIHPNAGSGSALTKLTDEEVLLIREAGRERARLRAEAMKLSNEELGKKFDVGPTVISDILTYRRWKYLP